MKYTVQGHNSTVQLVSCKLSKTGFSKKKLWEEFLHKTCTDNTGKTKMFFKGAFALDSYGKFIYI